MMPNINKLIVSVITKPAPYVSPLWPPNDLFRIYGIMIEVIKPEKMQYINNKLLERFILFNNRKNIIPKRIVINDGLISFDIPFQYFWWIKTDSLLEV